MKKTITISLLLLLIGEVFGQVKIGQTELPDIQVKDLQGKKMSLKECIKPGKNYVLAFWATWCVPCKRELSNMVDLTPKWKKEFNAEVLAISTDDSRAESKIKSFVAGEDWPYTVLLDQNRDLMRALGIQSIPFTMIVNGEGKIVFNHNSYVEGDEYELENKLAEIAK